MLGYETTLPVVSARPVATGDADGPAGVLLVTGLKGLVRLADIGAAGRHWYTTARQTVAGIAHRTGRPDAHAYLALFSPRCSVTRNIRNTLYFLDTSQFPHDVPHSVRRSVEFYQQSGLIRGPKVSAFSRALAGDDSAVVIDTHMARAFRILDHTGTHIPRHAFREAIRRITRLAHHLQVTPCQAQAMVWTGQYLRHYANGNPPQYVVPELGPSNGD